MSDCCPLNKNVGFNGLLMKYTYLRGKKKQISKPYLYNLIKNQTGITELH